MNRIAVFIMRGFCAALLLFSCSRTVVDVEPDSGAGILFSAHKGLPSDTAGGLYGIGIAKPTPDFADPARLQSQAEHGALMRILGRVRSPQEFGISATEEKFLACLESMASQAYVHQEILPNKTVHVGIYIGRENVGAFLECLKKTDLP